MCDLLFDSTPSGCSAMSCTTPYSSASSTAHMLSSDSKIWFAVIVAPLVEDREHMNRFVNEI